MAAEKKIEVDRSKIQKAIKSGIPLTITTYTLPHEMEVYMGDVLRVFLEELDQGHMIEFLTYCLNELMTNAKKANTKRVYFKKKKLDITKQEDYDLGMKTFKEDTLNDIHYYLSLQKDAGLYVKLVLQVRNNKIRIDIRNNSALTIFEYKRIHDKLSRVQQYTSVEEALSQVLDDSEGAGLGLIIMILMLEKIGLTEENFQTLCENGETITRIILPLSEKTQKQISLISEEFVRIIDNLPQFPENITEINRLISDPESKMSDIAAQISNDVALTGELLKMVNSAAFALSSPCHSITDAVKLVGLRGIKNMLFSIGSMQTFKEAGGNREELWTHAYQVAFYSYNLARNFFSKDRAVVEDAYVCGLLHDMGKIIFETSRGGESEQKILAICESRGISADLFERLVAGVNHGAIGAAIAEKWNFPEVITNVIRYHHSPEDVKANIRTLTCVVYLADLLTYYQTGEVAYYQIDQEVLDLFKISNEDQLQKVSDVLKKSFKKDQDQKK
ncbi:MAG: HDOD domain-containing protein [Treponema sp.]|nr:HDOD domain-containing protein [Treponema sp.]